MSPRLLGMRLWLESEAALGPFLFVNPKGEYPWKTARQS
jgi:hypothetical protein